MRRHCNIRTAFQRCAAELAAGIARIAFLRTGRGFGVPYFRFAVFRLDFINITFKKIFICITFICIHCGTRYINCGNTRIVEKSAGEIGGGGNVGGRRCTFKGCGFKAAAILEDIIGTVMLSNEEQSLKAS